MRHAASARCATSQMEIKLECELELVDVLFVDEMPIAAATSSAVGGPVELAGDVSTPHCPRGRILKCSRALL